ncbi:hypothetical protein I2485_01930 [Nesterenkonia sp. E16_7]|uniref:hypothetical protein n=1 Tax=unclassified Nesterenkonia TaxID=2629769 RepID=UPI001A920B3C|nr:MULTISPECIES: hypothetical protein [unclassified Nesterenkonia]MBO0596365.1 hypothetical protein [Nesterenkonia sp. E16_10]MBO0597407.1 hypothetical protein [Nesterenkonia sp. E16_7]
MTVTARTSTGVDHPILYSSNSGAHRMADEATAVGETYLDVIIGSIVNQPRSQQTRIGPSEMGQDCRRAILHRLNGDRPPQRADVPWKPTIGTAVHDYLERTFNTVSAEDGSQPGRYLTEERVTVGTIGFQEIDGSTDLYDTWGKAVIDHKIIGKSSMKKYRAHGPSEQYRKQAHLYGKGWAEDGWQVDMVMIAFLPREGELTDTYLWSEPYNPRVAWETLQRTEQLEQLRRSLGIEAALALYSPCDYRFCDWCNTGTRFEKQAPASTTAELFATA